MAGTPSGKFFGFRRLPHAVGQVIDTVQQYSMPSFFNAQRRRGCAGSGWQLIRLGADYQPHKNPAGIVCEIAGL